MTSIEILPLIALVAMFVIATFFPINIGILGFIGAFVVGYFALGYDDKEILTAFPSSIVLTIVGVTYFFGMAKRNGTIDLLVNSCIRAVHGRVTVVPWVFFFVASVLTALGTFSPAAVALIVPAAMAFAARTGMSPLVMGIMVINGAHAGAFSPISVSGVLVRDIVESNGLALSPWALFFASYGINLLLSVMTVVGYAALARMKGFEYTATGSTDPAPGSGPVGGSPVKTSVPSGGTGGGSSTGGSTQVLTRPTTTTLVDAPAPVTFVQKLTLFLIGALLVLVLVLHLPISFIAIGAGAVLAFTDLKKQNEAIADISWSTVLLVAGMVTYISILQEVGTIDHLAEMAITIGAPIIVAIVLCYVIGITSAFASSTALLAAVIPLAMPLLGTGALPVVGVVAALAISATVVDVSPFSTNGALVLANAQNIERPRFYRQLLLNAGIVVAIAPALCWLILVVVPELF
ncbi:C4-dicarboxylate ABC transporter [Rhodococcus sp. 05-2256-B2]|uniref:SLC13 family permease n=1 Tax=unclassified Rhodococcus (in: high G+C Gram-positive bacteria) TaxID=192944 RepID=UPI000B9C6E9C|nr:MULTISPECIES: SLC13 family permease [unclassified Rhodococcus (in: high G+C Gram-positive bacteria)]OZD84442.1 C4-dicarboxylate ABC transporter [Rhodococcus sp. 05-2256-B4]OZD88967.1 C4-dicarboxylate ABC transporter [Rhodococcus sp. 05-2256-B3]OZD93459.1 C4-dicarboxylate ABC transporter [Rhodococcus sp. 05-2256-B2]OZE03450.1 C4-dicarboxylate ABC transporter [Rhodococcus sp. 05-2256-B1]